VALLSDITERKHADEALRASGKPYRSLVIATASIVWSVDLEGAVGEDISSWQTFTEQTPE
jgi:hypothetical protein